MQFTETPEETAREIVRVLLNAGRTAGTGMPIASLHKQFGYERKAEFDPGFEFARAAEWIEVRTSGPYWVGLTDRGIAACS